MAELRGVLASFNRVSLRVLVFDARIQRESSFTEQDLHRLDKLDIPGGGGTDFHPVLEACDQQPPQP
ncbi:VWA-like domain-containing protein [Halomonas beimenensis]|uniref:VWA-like domain-containing protein n=1 Tax=Halomonas beimenensis TaxID=475662 RepID=UPI00360A5746